MINDETEMKVGSVFGTVKQRTGFRLEDLSVDGLETVDSVGGWLRADGALVVGQSPWGFWEGPYVVFARGRCWRTLQVDVEGGLLPSMN